MNKPPGNRIGFVGTRFAGTDGVSLEASKWAKILWDNRHVSYWFAGKLNTNPDVGLDRFIDQVSDIKLVFQTYGFSGD